MHLSTQITVLRVFGHGFKIEYTFRKSDALTLLQDMGAAKIGGFLCRQGRFAPRFRWTEVPSIEDCWFPCR